MTVMAKQPGLDRDGVKLKEVTLDVSLLEVSRRLGMLGLAALPVVDAPTGRVLGTVGHAAITARYSRALAGRTG